MKEAKTKMAKRSRTQLRPIRIQRHFTQNAAGSVLIEMGNTKVLCTASWDSSLPPWRKESGLGWVTAEYSMLPGSTMPRKGRPKTGHTDSRGLEIQRLIGRALRSVVDFSKLGPNTIAIDCDVLQADGGTRTAAINGGFIALVDAVHYGLKMGFISENPLVGSVAAISVGIHAGKPVLDLDYDLDSTADVDMNVVMMDNGRFVELQGTAEKEPFGDDQLKKMLGLARRGIRDVLGIMEKNLKKSFPSRKKA